MVLPPPNPQFGARRIRARAHPIANCAMVCAQFGRHVTALRPGRSLPGSPPPAERLGDIGDADQQHRRDLADPHAAVRSREHPFAQILRVSLAPLVQHDHLRSTGGR
jgi:hypothetical protein